MAIWSTYVVLLTLLVLYKFNFIFPINENEFIFSGDFVRPITVDSAVEFYLQPFFVNEDTESVDAAAPIRIAYWGFILLFSYFAPINVVYWMLIIATHVGGSALILLSFKKILNKRNLHWMAYYSLPFIPAVFFLLSYPVNYRPYWLFLPLLPAILYFVLTLHFRLESTASNLKTKQKVALIFLGYVSILQPHLFVIITAGLVLYSIGVVILAKTSNKSALGASLFRSSRLMLWFSVPAIVILLPLGLLQSLYDIEISPSYSYNLEVLKSTSKNSNLPNSLAFSNGFWEKVVFSEQEKAITIFMALAVITFAGILSRRKSERTFFVPAIAIFGILITFELGYNNPVYRVFADPNFSFSWLFRDPFKISLAALGFFLFLFSLLIMNLTKGRAVEYRRLRGIALRILIVPLIVFASLWSPLQKTSGILQPSSIPEEYFEASRQLNAGSQGPVLFLPDAGTSYEWAANKNLQSSFLSMTYKDESLGPTITTNPHMREFIEYSLQTGNTEALDLVAAGVVVDSSIVTTNYNDTINKYLGSGEKLGNYLRLIKNEDYQRFSVHSDDPVYLVHSTDYKYLSSVNLKEDRPIVFFDHIYEASTKAEGARILQVRSSYGDASNNWINGYAHDPLHGAWHKYLNDRGIENWQSDYGGGIVFTWSPPQIRNSLQLIDENLVQRWDFSSASQIDEWKSTTPQKQSGAVQEVKWEDESMKSILWNSTKGWKLIRSPLISVQANDLYRFSMDIKTGNAQYVHLKLIEYDKENRALGSKNFKILGDGPFDWKTVSYDYRHNNADVAFVQLQIWHGNETTKALPNVIWIDSVDVHNITEYVKPAALNVPFESGQGDYRLFIRYLKSVEGGSIKVYLDDKPVVISTKDQINKFVWEDIGLFSLNEGKHRIILENSDGFNAVNLFSLIPDKEYDRIQRQIAEQLAGESLLYVLEEGDLDGGAVQGLGGADRVLALGKDPGSWQEIDVIRDGSYRIAVKGEGKVNVGIAGRTFDLTLDSGDFDYTTSMDLKRGTASMTVTALDDSRIDAILLYSARNNGPLGSFLGEKDGDHRIISSEKIDPVTWKIGLDTEKKVLLEFAQYYDPLWEARIYKDGKLAEISRPVQLYGVLNGFNISTLGNTEIIIRHRAQDIFEQLAPVSGLGFALVGFYLVYDWRSYRRDGWTVRMQALFSLVVLNIAKVQTRKGGKRNGL